MKRLGIALLCTCNELLSVKIKHYCPLLSFKPWCRVQGKGPSLSRLFKSHLFGLDIYHDDVCVKLIADRDSVGFSCKVLLQDRLCFAFSITRNERSEQTIRFSGTCGSPAEWTEEVVFKDSAVEVRWHLGGARSRSVRDF